MSGVADTGPVPGARERLHPAFLLTGLVKSVRGAWGLAVVMIYLASSGRAAIAAWIAIAYLGVTIGGAFLRWLRFDFRVGRDEIRIDSGLLSRNSRVIPFDRVTDIDIEQGPIHRLFGLARVRFETGAAAGVRQEEGLLETVPLARAAALREHVRARRSLGPVEEVAPPDEEPGKLLYAMTLKRLLLAGLFNFSLAILAGLVGLSQTLGDVVGFDPFSRSFWNRVLVESDPLRQLVLEHRAASVVGGILVLGFLGLVTGLFRTILREFGFRLERTTNGLRRTRGLFTRTDVSIPLRRIQAALIVTDPVRQSFGWFSLRLQSLASDGGQGDHVVAPLADEAECAAIQRALGQPVEPAGGLWQRAEWAYVISMVPILIPAVLIGAAAMLAGMPAMIGLPLAALGAIAVRYMKWRRSRWALDPATLFVDSGWWWRRRLILPLRRIQSIDLSENAWSRRLGFCALRLGVAGGSGLQVHHILALSRPDAEALRARLLAA